jgi:hypothetical protein
MYGSMLAVLRYNYVKFSALSNEFIFGGEDDAGCQVDDTVRTCTKDIIPDSADGLDARENVRKPCQDPGDNEDDKIDLAEALEDALELFILADQKS